MAGPLTCWVLSDGRRGIENQALGLAEAMARQSDLDIQTHHISRKGLLALLPAGMQKLFRPSPLPDDLPNIAIGCGRQAIAPLLDLREKGVFTVYVQDPRIGPEKFDVVIAPESGVNPKPMTTRKPQFTPMPNSSLIYYRQGGRYF